MKRATLLLCALSVICVKTEAVEAVEMEAFLDATRLIEAVATPSTGSGRFADGRHQERGAYGIRPATWRQHMGTLPFALARTERWGRECARRHVAWLQRELRAAGVEANVFNLALAYNAGLETVLRSRAPASAYDYATRLRNLYRLPEPGAPRHVEGLRPLFIIP